MPNFEFSASLDNDATEMAGSNAYGKILALFHRHTGSTKSIASRNFEAKVVFKSDISYEAVAQTYPSGGYTKLAGGDLSSIFMPFQTKVGSGTMPSFYENLPTSGNMPSGVKHFYNFLPFKWEASESGFVYDRWQVSNNKGDAIPNLLSGEKYYGDTDRYRDISNIRGIALRLPAIGVGWGYTTSGHPWPSGTGGKFRGGYDFGYQVDLGDYIAAPIDFVYDISRNVWTIGTTPPSGTTTLPTGQYEHQHYQMITQNQGGWDFPRAHPPLE